MGRLLLIAGRNLLVRPGRTLLLGLAVCLLTCLLTLAGSLTRAVYLTMTQTAIRVVTGHVNVAGFHKVKRGTAVPLVTGARHMEARLRRWLPGAEVVSRQRGYGTVVSPTRSDVFVLNGIDIERDRPARASLESLRGDTRALRRPGAVALFESQARDLGVDVGDTITVTSETVIGTVNASDLEVVAVVRDLGQLAAAFVFVSKDTVRAQHLMPRDSTGAFEIYLEEPKQAQAVADRLRQQLAAAGFTVRPRSDGAWWDRLTSANREEWTGQQLDVATWEGEFADYTFVVTLMQVVSTISLAILLAITVAGILNTLFMSIRERTSEIGTLRAIGMGRLGVTGMFMLEAGILGSVGAAAGGLLAALAATIVNHAAIKLPPAAVTFLLMDRLWLAAEPAAIGSTVATIGVATTLFAAWPALRASRVPPITAIHHVG